MNEAPGAQPGSSRLTFFRQSGWMMMATVAGGAFMWAVHPAVVKPVDQVPLGAITEWLRGFVQEPLSKADYGLLTTLIQIVNLMGIPAIGLQTVFAHQTASVVTEAQQRQLRGTVRGILAATMGIWGMAALGVLFFHDRLTASLKINEPWALWLTVLTALPVLWTPVLGGVLQGRQNFLWYGWTSIIGGMGRCLVVVLLVRLIGFRTAGAIAGVMLGATVGLLVCVWQTSWVLRGPSEGFDWRGWLRRVIPLTLGLGTSTAMMSADMILVRRVFAEEPTGYYSAAGIIGRALVFFTVPLTAVMFPKVVKAAALAERTDVLAQALGATALLGAAAALFCTVFPELPLRVVYDQSYLVISPLVPWFVWCMLPLTLANVLINNLLARQRFYAVPWLVLVVLGYGATLMLIAPKLPQMEQMAAFRMVVQSLGGFSLLLLAVTAWFTWKRS